MGQTPFLKSASFLDLTPEVMRARERYGKGIDVSGYGVVCRWRLDGLGAQNTFYRQVAWRCSCPQRVILAIFSGRLLYRYQHYRYTAAAMVRPEVRARE